MAKPFREGNGWSFRLRVKVNRPVDSGWDSWFDGEQVSDDFMAERDQPGQPQWEPL